MQGTAPHRPGVSVVVPLYQKAATIRRALDSVVSQTVTDLEVIVVNDGSTDAGPEIARAHGDPRIRVVDQPNRGVGAARNRGITEARADLIALLDADDTWDPGFLEVILGLRAAFPSASVYATSYAIRTRSAVRRAVLSGVPEGFVSGILPDYFRVAAASDPPLWTSAVAFTRPAIESVGGFPEGISSGEDLLTWARLALAFEIAYSATPGATFFAPTATSDRPGRRPQVPDLVGRELARLLEGAPANRRRELARYVALWHRMRAVIFLHLGERRNARVEVLHAVRRHAMTARLLVLLALTCAPTALATRAFSALQRARGVSS